MWLLLACNGPEDVEPVDDSVVVDESTVIHSGDTGAAMVRFVGAGGGFGHALTWDGERVLVGAPWAGSVHGLDNSEVASGDEGFGFALAVGEELLVGNPLDGSLLDGRVDSYGAVVRFDGEWLLSNGASAEIGSDIVDLPRRPSDLVRWNGLLVAGFASGEDALWIEGATVPRPEAEDAAGYALCVGDVDSDGADELVVGAPNAGVVYVLDSVDFGDAEVLEGQGRFGHAVACGDGLLVVSSPLFAEDLAGAVRIYDDLVPSTLIEGESGDWLGTSVLVVEDAVYAGAPGSIEGAVLRLR